MEQHYWTRDAGVQHDAVRWKRGYFREFCNSREFYGILTRGDVPQLWYAPHGWSSGTEIRTFAEYRQVAEPLMRAELERVRSQEDVLKEPITAGHEGRTLPSLAKRTAEKRARK